MGNRYIVGCGAVIRNKEGKYLLVRQLNGYWKDRWIFPGGKLELGETLEECARREIMEETGCEVLLKHQVGTYISYDPDTQFEKQVVLIYYKGEYRSGIPVPGDDVCDVRWFSFSELENMAAQGLTPGIIFQVALDSAADR